MSKTIEIVLLVSLVINTLRLVRAYRELKKLDDEPIKVRVKIKEEE